MARLSIGELSVLGEDQRAHRQRCGCLEPASEHLVGPLGAVISLERRCNEHARDGNGPRGEEQRGVGAE